MRDEYGEFSDFTAPLGHVTFTVLDIERSGHSVGIDANEYTKYLCNAKTVLAGISATAIFNHAIRVIGRSVGCADGCARCADDELLCAFVSALLKHPDKRQRKTLTNGISDMLKKEGGAHVILIIPPTGLSVWMLAAPRRQTTDAVN